MNNRFACSDLSTYPKTESIADIITIVKIGKNRNLIHSISTSISDDFFPNFFLIIMILKYRIILPSKTTKTFSNVYCVPSALPFKIDPL